MSSFISLIFDLYFGFKNYCSYYCFTVKKNMELPLINKDGNNIIDDKNYASNIDEKPITVNKANLL